MKGQAINSDQAFGTLANRLLEKGYVKRSPGKGRAVVHELTPLGKKLRKEGNQHLLDLLDSSFGSLTATEQKTLLALLRKVHRSQKPTKEVAGEDE